MTKEQQFWKLYCDADRAGVEAAQACSPTPMVVEGYEDQPVMGGVCGFAWVVIKPATTAFARWLKKNGHARKAYGGGLSIWISRYQQSMERKQAHAQAMARVLRDAGYNAYAQSRMD